MSRSATVRVLLGLCCALPLLATSARAEDGASKDQTASSDRLARLEALLAAQQQRIEALQEEVAATSMRDVEAARLDVMRQQIREVLSETEFRESLMQSTTQTGYDNGFFIRSSDDNFLMKINGYTQFRWTHYATRSSNKYLNPGFQRDDRTGFDLQRIRLIFSGHVHDKDLTYHLQIRGDAPDGYDVLLHWAYLNYRFRDEFQIRAGIFKLASTRSQLTDESGFQFVDRPMTEAVFGLSDGLGIRFWGQLFDKRFEYRLDIVNSLNRGLGRTITPDPAELDSNPAILFRAVWNALGENPGNSEMVTEGDTEMRDDPFLSFGFHYAFNDDMSDASTTRIPFGLPRRFGTGGFGLTTTNGLQINQFGLDTMFKYQGFSASGLYVLRIVDPRRAGRRPFTPWWLATGQGSTTVQHGAYAQFGYFLPIPALENKLEAVVRVGGISTLAADQEGTWEYAAGLNYYIKGHKIKLQTDVTKVSEVPISNSASSLANVNDDALIFRVQLQVAF